MIDHKGRKRYSLPQEYFDKQLRYIELLEGELCNVLFSEEEIIEEEEEESSVDKVYKCKTSDGVPSKKKFVKFLDDDDTKKTNAENNNRKVEFQSAQKRKQEQREEVVKIDKQQQIVNSNPAQNSDSKHAVGKRNAYADLEEHSEHDVGKRSANSGLEKSTKINEENTDDKVLKLKNFEMTQNKNVNRESENDRTVEMKQAPHDIGKSNEKSATNPKSTVNNGENKTTDAITIEECWHEDAKNHSNVTASDRSKR